MGLRLRRLFRTLTTIVLSFLRILYAPAGARDFLAYAYLYRPLPYSRQIKQIVLPEIIPETEKISATFRKFFPQHGNMTGEEIIALCVLEKWKNPRGIFEFGTFNGMTTLQLAINAPKNCPVYTLNLPPDHGETQLSSSAQDKLVHPKTAGSGQAFRGEPEAERIRELFGDSATFDFSPHAGRCDFVLVDAGHEYDYVKSDTMNALRLLPTEGGVIVWHDFPNAPGVCAWLEEYSAQTQIYHLRNTRLAFTIIKP